MGYNRWRPASPVDATTEEVVAGLGGFIAAESFAVLISNSAKAPAQPRRLPGAQHQEER